MNNNNFFYISKISWKLKPSSDKMEREKLLKIVSSTTYSKKQNNRWKSQKNILNNYQINTLEFNLFEHIKR